jgi:hypothetical protein
MPIGVAASGGGHDDNCSHNCKRKKSVTKRAYARVGVSALECLMFISLFHITQSNFTNITIQWRALPIGSA